jgi:hypothetical protein
LLQATKAKRSCESGVDRLTRTPRSGIIEVEGKGGTGKQIKSVTQQGLPGPTTSTVTGWGKQGPVTHGRTAQAVTRRQSAYQVAGSYGGNTTHQVRILGLALSKQGPPSLA